MTQREKPGIDRRETERKEGWALAYGSDTAHWFSRSKEVATALCHLRAWDIAFLDRYGGVFRYCKRCETVRRRSQAVEEMRNGK
jgi:hypothetical protein